MAVAVPAQSSEHKPFTVAEEIGLASFDGSSSPLVFSPNRRFVAIMAERGLLKEDRVEDEVRVYEVAALKDFVQGGPATRRPRAILDLRESTYKRGPIIAHVRWLNDSAGLVFLLRNKNGVNQLAVMGLAQSRPKILSLSGQDVTAFDVRDADHYAYTVASVQKNLRPAWSDRRVAWDGTGYSLPALLIPLEWKAKLIESSSSPEDPPRRSVLWAAMGSKPYQVLQPDGREIVLYPSPGSSLALAPNGNKLAAVLPVSRVPTEWIHKFLASGAFGYHMRAGYQELGTTGYVIATEYVIIDIRTGRITPINGAPTGVANGWFAIGAPLAWSDDSSALLLPDAYPKPKRASQVVQRPCVAVFELRTRIMQCLEALRSMERRSGGPERGFFTIKSLRFMDHKSAKIALRYDLRGDDYAPKGTRTKIFVRGPDNEWQVEPSRERSSLRRRVVDIYIKQGLNDPPRVIVRDNDSKEYQVIWDPNPQLKEIALGTASIYRWTDAGGHRWNGGLYKPPNYVAGRRYPLVIQTHGFLKAAFRPSGLYPTAFAARALAAGGILVLQIPYCLRVYTPESGGCDIGGIDAAVNQLVSQGVADPNRIGIIGFSYTVYDVMKALSASNVRFAAASITDGPSCGYWAHVSEIDWIKEASNQVDECVSAIGARPIGTGLQRWLATSPDFNLQGVHTPLLIVSLGRVSLLTMMWEPYAILKYLNKPVDLVLLHSREHVLTEPAVRMASQQGSVDWFRFWLLGELDRKVDRAQQYRLWRNLCELQRTENPGRPSFCIGTK